jgi:hypothetical protein
MVHSFALDAPGSDMKTALKRTGAFLAAAAVTTLLGTVAQTQFNLARLAGLGAAVPPDLRLEVTLRDLAGFAPTFGALTLAGFLVAFLVSGLIRRRVPRGRAALYAVAGAVAIATMLLAMKAALGLVAIAAARGAGGFAVLIVTGAIGGWTFARLTASRSDAAA